ncbi:MAG: hypothetical protein HYX94_04430 [Chloroflexi bacterium]|nr:hypothetical protein [Chloroflexota bacterium]
MIERDVLFEVLDALDALSIPYMIVGSFASTYWGRPRTTHDADIVVEIPQSKAGPLARSLDTDFYAPEPVIEEAVQRRGQFNAIHLGHPFKVDLWLRQETPYERARFGRRRQVTMLGRMVWITTAEDVILSKLVWYKAGPALHRQFEDALEVFEIQEPNLDQPYLDHWARVLDVADLMGKIRDQAAGPP